MPDPGRHECSAAALATVLRLIGNSEAEMGEPEAALASYVRSLELNPRDATTHRDYALVLLSQNRYGDAVRHLDEAARLNPALPDLEMFRTQARAALAGATRHGALRPTPEAPSEAQRFE